MSVSSIYPLFQKTKIGQGVSHTDIFMLWLGGIDFVYQLSRKKQQLHLSLHTNLPNLHFLSPRITHHSIDIYSVCDLPSTAQLALSGGGDVFCSAKHGQNESWFYVSASNSSSLIMNGQSWSLPSLQAMNSHFQLHILENPQQISSVVITKQMMKRFVEKYRTVHANIKRWLLLCRRASMRNNWMELLETREGYFQIATQSYLSLSSPLGAHREQFGSCLSHCSMWLSEPALAHAARDFRLSSQQWQRLAEVLISLEDPSLQEAMLLIRLGTWNSVHEEHLKKQFVRSQTNIDLSFRLEVLQHTLERILTLESKALEAIEQTSIPHLELSK